MSRRSVSSIVSSSRLCAVTNSWNSSEIRTDLLMCRIFRYTYISTFGCCSECYPLRRATVFGPARRAGGRADHYVYRGNDWIRSETLFTVKMEASALTTRDLSIVGVFSGSIGTAESVIRYSEVRMNTRYARKFSP